MQRALQWVTPIVVSLIALPATAGMLPAVVPNHATITATLPADVVADAGGQSLHVVVDYGGRLEATTIVGDGVALTWRKSGSIDTTLVVSDASGAELLREQRAVRVLPGSLTFVPAILAIVLSLLLRDVVLALFGGLVAGSLLLTAGPLGAITDALDRVVGALADKDRATIIVFSLLLGGMVGVIQRNGGTAGIVRMFARRARSARDVEMTTWVLGLVIFFDDYANSLLLGTTMRPLTDSRRVAREKLAFLVDSTAAPVASVALFSTWIGFELDQIKTATGLDDGATYQLFIESLAFRFYPILMLAFIVMLIATRRSFGPMLAAERRALETGEVSRPGSTPASTFAETADSQPAGHWADAALPILAVVATTCICLYVTGRDALIASGAAINLRAILSQANSYSSLLQAAFAGCLVAMVLNLVRRTLSLKEWVEAWLGGIRSMLVAVVILVLASALGTLCKDLFVPQYTVALLGDTMPSAALPAAVFLAACVASLATGSSWSTIAILTPLVAPLSLALATTAGLDAAGQHTALVAAIGSILAGSIFGDHCSPLSDTTVLSSLASSCDHVDHVRTQAPYAVVVAAVSVLCGNLLTALGLPLPVAWLVALAALAGFLFLFGKVLPEPPTDAETPG